MSETPRTDNFIADNDIFCDSKELLLFTNFAQQLEAELADARAEIERRKQLWSCNLDIIGGELNKQLIEARTEIERKDKLIERLRKALKHVLDNCCDEPTIGFDIRVVEAALLEDI